MQEGAVVLLMLFQIIRLLVREALAELAAAVMDALARQQMGLMDLQTPEAEVAQLDRKICLLHLVRQEMAAPVLQL